jgi:tetratricopeptide (TPR) repeat protein
LSFVVVTGNAYLDVGKVQDALNSFQQVVLLDPEHADAYFNMAIIHEEHAAEESIEKNIRKQELEKAMRSYQAVESLSSKIDKELLEDAKKGIATIEHKLRACDNS